MAAVATVMARVAVPEMPAEAEAAPCVAALAASVGMGMSSKHV
jgi:hypothetical protein